MKGSYILLACLIVICSSCKKTPAKWDRDYYGYQIGAYINGVEYHEYRHWSTILSRYGSDLGFSREYSANRDTVRVYWQGWRRAFFSKPNESGISYCLIFAFVSDTEYFSSTNPIFFHGCDEDVYPYVYPSVNNPDVFKSGIAVVNGGLIRVDDEVFYRIKEGNITFGEFDDDSFLNKDKVTFEFTAENDNGDVLEVKDGYCNACKR